MYKNLPIRTRDLKTDLQPTNTSIEMDYATRVHMTRSGGYKNGLVRGLTREDPCV